MRKFAIFGLLTFLIGALHAQTAPPYVIKPASTGTSNQFLQYTTANTAATLTQPACATLSDSSIFCSASGANNAQTATYQVLAADFANLKTITVASGTFTITLVASGSQPANGKYIHIINYGSGVVTIARSGQNINGGTSSLTLPAATATAPTSADIYSDGTNYFARLTGTGSSATDYRYGYFEQDHFLYGVNVSGTKTKSFATGTGSGATAISAGDLHAGAVALDTQVTNGVVQLWGIGTNGTLPKMRVGDGTFEVDWWFNLQTLSSSTERYVLDLGMSSLQNIGDAGSYSFSAMYTDNPASLNGTMGIRVVVNGVAQTIVNGTTSLITTPWYCMRLVLDVPNANIKEYLGTSCSNATLEATYTGTLPTGAFMAPNAREFRTLGTAGSADRFIYTTGWQVSANYATQQ